MVNMLFPQIQPLKVSRLGVTALFLVLLILVSFLGLSEAKAADEVKQGDSGVVSSPSNLSPEGEQEQAPVSTPPAPEPIPIEEIATKATEVSKSLHALEGKLSQNEEIDKIKRDFPAALEKVGWIEKDTNKLLQSHTALPTLQAEQRKWQQIQLKFSNWLSTLTLRSKDLQKSLGHLNELQMIWSLTLSSAEASSAPAASLLQIKEMLSDVGKLMEPIEAEQTAVLNFQSKVGNAVADSESILANISQIREASMSRTLVQDSLPIWNKDHWSGAATKFSDNILSAVDTYKEQFTNYFRVSFQKSLFYTGLFVLLGVLFKLFQIKTRTLSDNDLTYTSSVKVFDHPTSAALTVVLLMATSPVWSHSPALFRDTLQFFALIPMIILVRRMVVAELVPCLYVLVALFALDTSREAVANEVFQNQLLLIAESTIGVIVSVWLLQKARIARILASGKYRAKLLYALTCLVCLALAVGLVTAVFGYVRLSLLITPGIIAAGVLALAMYALLKVVTGIVEVALTTWPLKTLGVVQKYRAMLERRLYRILALIVVLGVAIRYLSYLGLLAPTLDLGRSILQTKIEHGILKISLANILEFVLTVWFSFLLSAFIRLILREDVYPRTKMPEGNFYAASSLLHYFILAAGFIAAIAATGLDLTKLNVLTGAFGIGLGFGLQSVVNNFVSGLILLSERPVHVGDTVEVGNVLGKVSRIGIRASTMHTLQGAELIVPNSQLVADKVTNWTLSNRLRRVDLPVGVSYESDPDEVIGILRDVALKNPDVAQSPAPQCLMVGYGESSLDFELRVWTDQFDNWVQIRSELAVAVFHAVAVAGMTFPFPQRVVHLKKDPEDESKAK